MGCGLFFAAGAAVAAHLALGSASLAGTHPSVPLSPHHDALGAGSGTATPGSATVAPASALSLRTAVDDALTVPPGFRLQGSVRLRYAWHDDVELNREAPQNQHDLALMRARAGFVSRIPGIQPLRLHASAQVATYFDAFRQTAVIPGTQPSSANERIDLHQAYLTWGQPLPAPPTDRGWSAAASQRRDPAAFERAPSSAQTPARKQGWYGRGGRLTLRTAPSYLVNTPDDHNTGMLWDGAEVHAVIAAGTVRGEDGGVASQHATLTSHRSSGKRAWHLGAFATRVVPLLPSGFNTYAITEDRYANSYLHGLRAVLANVIEGLHSGVYVLLRHTDTREDLVFTAGPEFAWDTPLPGVSLTGIAALQWGEYNQEPHQASLVHSELNYRLPSSTRKQTDRTPLPTWPATTLSLGYTHASGDPDSSDGKHQTFDPLYHSAPGELDLVATQNVHQLQAAVETTFRAAAGTSLSLATTAQVHWLAEPTTDAWYRPGGGVHPTRGRSTAAYLGTELAAVARMRLVDDLVNLRLSYSHFFVGTHARGTAGPQDADYFALQLDVAL